MVRGVDQLKAEQCRHYVQERPTGTETGPGDTHERASTAAVDEGGADAAHDPPAASPANAPASQAAPPGKRKHKQELMDVDTAMAVLAEPFDEEAEADRPLPDSFVTAADGAKSPLPGVLSLFLTGSTLEIVGCSHLGADKQPPVLTCAVSKETILGDIQFRGAISDFHAFKAAIVDADCDPLLLRVNEADLYGDGNNFELAVKQQAAEQWGAAEKELERRRQRDATIARRKLAQRSLPASKKHITVRSR